MKMARERFHFMRFFRQVYFSAFVFSCCIFLCSASAFAKAPVLEFIEGLRHRGYYDTALQYLATVEADQTLPKEVREVLPYERGQTLLDHARTLNNLNDQRKQLDAAEASFEQFVKAAPTHLLAGRANTSRGRILLEQARVEIWDGDKPSNEGNRDLFRENARAMIKRAETIFQQAVGQHKKIVDSYPTFIPVEEKETIKARDEAVASHIEALLDLAQCQYWTAQTYDEGDAKRKEILTAAAFEFEEIHKKHRSVLGGLFARMWQGKCFEEQGEIGIALGLYEEILGHEGKSATMLSLKDRALRFRLICLNHEKRKDYKLVTIEGEEWLREAKARSRTSVGLGIQWEMCRAFEALGTDRTTPDSQKFAFLTQALNRSRTISRFPGELKTPATAMVQRVMVALNREPGDPKDFETANGNAKLLLDQVNVINTEISKLKAAGKNKEALAKQEELIAIAAEMTRLYDIALKLKRPEIDPILVNSARLRLAYGLLLQKKYYDSAAVAEYQMSKFSEEYPEVGLEAAFVAMASFDYAYSSADENNREFEAAMLTRMAEKIAERWPESDRANDARNAVAKIHFQAGNLLEAAAWYEKVPAGTSNYAQAQVSAGKSYWRQYVLSAAKPEGERPSGEDLTKWKAAAVKHLETGLAEAEKGIPADKPLPDDLVGAKLTLVSIRNLDGVYKKEKDGPQGALELLTAEPHPVIKAVAVEKDQARPKEPSKAQSREMASLAYQQLLRAQIGLKNLDAARKAREDLENVAGKEDAAALTQVYIEFGRELEQELDRLRAANEQERLAEVRAGFEAFLNDLYNREDGQTFYSLLWIAETYTSLADGSRDTASKSEEYFGKASDAYEKILTSVASDPNFVSDPSQVIGTKLRLASSLRRKPDYAAAETVILDILKTNPSALDAQFEAASLYQEWASSGELGTIEKFQPALQGSKEGDPITIWGWTKMAQYLQRELFVKKDERLEKLHYDARYHIAETELQWGNSVADEEEAVTHIRRAQAAVAGFQRISPRWPDEEYARFNALYQKILEALGSPIIDLPRDLDKKQTQPIDELDAKAQVAGTQATQGGEEAEASGGSSPLLMIVMLLFGGGAVAGLYYMAVGQNKKKYANYDPSTAPKRSEGDEPVPMISLPTAAPKEKPVKQKQTLDLGGKQKTATRKSTAKPTAKSTEKPAATKEKTKRKYTEEEIRKIKAARAAKARAAQKEAGGEAPKPQKPTKKRPKDPGK